MAGFYTAKYMVQFGKERRVLTKDFFLPDKVAVRQEIIDMGGQPLSIAERKVKWYQREFLGSKYKLGFLRSLAFHVNAGMSPGRALWIVIESEEHTGRRLELEPALEVLRRGGGFMTSMEQLRMYDTGTLAILASGERVGDLKGVITSAVEHLEEKGKIWKILFAALGWLWFDLSMALSSVFGVQFGYLPWVEEQGIKTTDKKLEADFYQAINIAYFINGALMLAAVLAIIMGVFVFISIIGARGKLEQISQKITSRLPLIKPFLENSAVAETFGIVGRMVKGKVQFAEAVRVAAEATPYGPLRRFWETTLERVSRGDTVDRAMRSPLLTRGEMIEIAAHQNSEQLAEMIMNICRERGEQSKRGLKKIIMSGVMFTIFFTFFSAGTALWVLWVQNKGVTATLNNISAGQ